MQHCPSCGTSFARFKTLEYGNVTVSESSEIFFRGINMHLGSSLRLVVDALIRAQGRPLARDTLLNILGGEENTDRSIDVHISRLRKIFTKAHPDFDQIVSVRGLGYRWQRKDDCAEELRLAA
jgi:two-component system, OmpR family, response regulator ChvI